MTTVDPTRARALVHSINEHRRLADEYSFHAGAYGHADVVYYIEFRGVIKIGTTIELEHRLTSLPWEILLGLEPGGRRVEQHRHRQFRIHRYMDEWFTDHQSLRQHVDLINERNADWRSDHYPGLDVPYEYPSQHRHVYKW
jgi:hypothetical protein